MKINIPTNVQTILNALHINNYKGYIVGGSVRDSILGRKVNDWDVCTSALPETVIKIFEDDYKVIETGLEHGTVTVLINGEHIEITTFRVDGEYTDGRHPDTVEYTNDIVQDLSRRDFTINAIAYNDTDGLIDPFGGERDLINKKIKCVGSAEDRFKEDALRMMRAIRFSNQLGFEIDKDVLFEMTFMSEKIKENVSVERIQSEFNKILLSEKQDSHGIYNLLLSGVLNHISNELVLCFESRQNNPYHLYNVGIHSMVAAKNIEPILHLRLTMIFHDIAKPITKTTDENGIDHFYKHAIEGVELAENILRRLKYDNDTISKVKKLIQFHDCAIPYTLKGVRRLLNKLDGEELIFDLIKVKYADMCAQSQLAYDEKYERLVNFENMVKEVLENKECFSRKDLAIDGKDLLELGFKQGKELGIILDRLLEYVIDNPDRNNKGDLIYKVLFL